MSRGCTSREEGTKKNKGGGDKMGNQDGGDTTRGEVLYKGGVSRDWGVGKRGVLLKMGWRRRSGARSISVSETATFRREAKRKGGVGKKFLVEGGAALRRAWKEKKKGGKKNPKGGKKHLSLEGDLGGEGEGRIKEDERRIA